MTRKSAAQFKPVKGTKTTPDLPPIEETFENAKQAFVNTLEASIVLAKRVDNFLNIRDYVIKFYNGNFNKLAEVGADRVDYVKRLQAITVSTYEKLLEISKTFELEEFCKEEMKNYYEDLVPDVDGIDTMDKALEAGLVFLTVKPFGEKMTALHHTILDEKAAREYEEK